MSEAFALSVASLSVLALLISAYWTDRRFANFEKLPRQYGLTGEPTAFASRKAMAWGIPLFLIAMLVVMAAATILAPSESANGDPWLNLTMSSVIMLAAQGLVMWLHTRWAAGQEQWRVPLKVGGSIDYLDRHLLNLLKQDARLPMSSLALSTGVSRATVRARIERLQREGVIARFTVELGPSVRNTAIRAIIHIEVLGTSTDDVTRRLIRLDDIDVVHSTNGRWDLVAQIECVNLQRFDDTLRMVRLIDGITKTESSLLLSSRYQAWWSKVSAACTLSHSIVNGQTLLTIWGQWAAFRHVARKAQICRFGKINHPKWSKWLILMVSLRLAVVVALRHRHISTYRVMGTY